MNSLIIIGAGGHGRVAADIAAKTGKYLKIEFLDDVAITGVVGKVADYVHYIDKTDFFVAIGNNYVRTQIFIMLEKNGASIVSLIHPRAEIGSDVSIGKGTVVMAGAVINADAVIGKGGIINTCSSVDHNCFIGDFCHISVGAHIAGTSTIGNNCFIGAGATVINNINICGDCTVGAGSVVVKDLKIPGIYKGVPAVFGKSKILSGGGIMPLNNCRLFHAAVIRRVA